MDLRTGCAFWLVKNGLMTSYPSLSTDVSADVAIIGAGITGALLAYELTRAGASVVVVDRRDAASGSTAASTGLLLYETDASLEELATRVGLPAAVRVYQLGRRAVDRIEQLCEAVGDRSGFSRRHCLYLASSRRDSRALAREHALRVAHGFDVRWLQSQEIRERFGLRAHGAIYSSGDGEIDTYRFTQRLLMAAAADGARIYDRTEIVRTVPRAGRIELRAKAGGRIEAHVLVVAAGYEMAEQKALRRYTNLNSTFACVTEPVATFWEERCLIWETARPYVYLRTTDDNRISIGGEDSPFSTRHRSLRVVEKKRDRLMARLRAMFPHIDAEPAYAWGGVFGETADGLPFIGPRGGVENIWYALGYGANGITGGVTAADILRDRYLGRRNSDAALFAFER